MGSILAGGIFFHSLFIFRFPEFRDFSKSVFIEHHEPLPVYLDIGQSRIQYLRIADIYVVLYTICEYGGKE